MNPLDAQEITEKLSESMLFTGGIYFITVAFGFCMIFFFQNFFKNIGAGFLIRRSRLWKNSAFQKTYYINGKKFKLNDVKLTQVEVQDDEGLYDMDNMDFRKLNKQLRYPK